MLIFNSNKFVPLLFIGIIVIFIFIILSFVYTAYSTFTGLVTENAYQKGLDFGKINQFSLAQPSQDVKADITIINNTVNLKINTNLQNYSLEAKIVKPVSSEFDQFITFNTLDNDLYRAVLPKLKTGVWEIRVKITHDDNDYVFNRRFMIL